MTTKFNVYYATTPTGPWTLANTTPIDRIDGGNSYTVTGLQSDTLYYFKVVPGTVDEDDNFIPHISQPIGPVPEGAGDVTTRPGIPIAARTFSPKKVSSDSLSMQFEVDSIV